MQAETAIVFMSNRRQHSRVTQSEEKSNSFGKKKVKWQLKGSGSVDGKLGPDGGTGSPARPQGAAVMGGSWGDAAGGSTGEDPGEDPR